MKRDKRVPKTVTAVYGRGTEVDASVHIKYAIEELNDWRSDWTLQDLLTVISTLVCHRIPFSNSKQEWVFFKLNKFVVKMYD